MIEVVVGACLPGRHHRVSPAAHPYTRDGLQIDVQAEEAEGGWVEVGECGLAHPALLQGSGLDPAQCSGLAMGIGLDRVLMLRKGIDDIRLLRAGDPRVARQMLDLSPYRSVSNQPAIRRDMSIAVAVDTNVEDLGDRVRAALAERADAVEEVTIISETCCAELPPQALARMGLSSTQKNVLLRVVLRHPTDTLTRNQANQLRNQIYAALHEGSRAEWA
jgi:phenylalanyl-tRNA synthetase alpha chain